jgi:SAM-dependent methyltransferase
MARRRPARNKWAKGENKRHIIEQRKFLWEPEYVALLAKWVGFKPGQTVVDVGCGLGYLGTIYWPYFGNKGKYCGVDVSPKLIAQAKKLSKGWVKNGAAEFKVGDAYNLPYPDKYADVVMCQTLLMHLKYPQKAINEMYRILKPGGAILCKEPDNLSATLQHAITSLPELKLDEELFLHKIAFICNNGRAVLGLGNYNAGLFVPLWMKEAGFNGIDARMNSYPAMGIPPYDTPRQEHARISREKDIRINETPKEKRKRSREFKKLFMAGGGSIGDYRKYLAFGRKNRSQKKIYKTQIKDRAYYFFAGSIFFAIKGHKPK